MSDRQIWGLDPQNDPFWTHFERSKWGIWGLWHHGIPGISRGWPKGPLQGHMPSGEFHWMPSGLPDWVPDLGSPEGSILDPKLVDFGVPDLDLNVNHSNLEGPDPDLNVNHSKSEVPDPDLNVIHSGFGGPDPQIDRFWTHLGSKSGGAGLAGLPKSLCTAVQPARMAVRRGQNPSRIMTKMGYFGGPDPQIWMLTRFGHVLVTWI